ncbi:MAG: hypothetical protein HUU55_21740 [Myxococcales bacterium]|nr:hypothetical protein [Myxococcales bacterium]
MLKLIRTSPKLEVTWERMVPAVFFAMTLVLAFSETDAAPVVLECKGPLLPSVVGGCSNVGNFGCCDVVGRLLWCDDNDLFCMDCGDNVPYCGWNQAGYYDCGQPKNISDPTGVHPISCDGCSPTCTKDPTCRPECTGPCGQCAAPGAVCTDSGTCYAPSCGNNECGKDPSGFSCGVCDPTTECVPGLQQCLPLPPPCVPSGSPGCDGCVCESCVCAKYPTCCTEQWDVFCAAACELECGYDCSACPKNPTCSGNACGEVCGKNCGTCEAAQVCYQNQCCKPNCEGKLCGSDGCGGQCGSCGLKLECKDGQCVTCEPKCNGKECGPDGCGSQCGVCDEPLQCVGGNCSTGYCEGHCGEGNVSCGKNCTCSCDPDCLVTGNCCDGLCTSCPTLGDCCTPNCEDIECGNDGCGGSCGSCTTGFACQAGECAPCTPHCVGKECGDDKCNGSCGTCESGFVCEENQCVPCVPQCDGLVCGPDGCGGSCGECGADAVCQLGRCYECFRDCLGKNCGSDGCGGTCGTCQEGKYCLGGQCIGDPETCQGVSTVGCCDGSVTYWCAGGNLQQKNCALEGNVCGWNEEYSYYGCVPFSSTDPLGIFPYACPFCQPECGVKQCGDDGCGGSCGECGTGQQCKDGACLGVKPIGDVVDGGAGNGNTSPDKKDDDDGCVVSRRGVDFGQTGLTAVFLAGIMVWCIYTIRLRVSRRRTHHFRPSSTHNTELPTKPINKNS